MNFAYFGEKWGIENGTESAYLKNFFDDFLQVTCINCLLDVFFNVLVVYSRIIHKSLD